MIPPTTSQKQFNLIPMPQSSSPIVIIHQTPAASFGWSDFPVVENYSYHNSTAPLLTTESKKTQAEVSEERPIFESFDWSSRRNAKQTLKHEESKEQPIDLQLNTSTKMKNSICPKKKTRKDNKKNVSFSTLEIRHHEVILGDHPLATSLPLSLGWNYDPESVITTVDEYEEQIVQRRQNSHRPDHLKAIVQEGGVHIGRHRRKTSEFRLTHCERLEVLVERYGKTEDEILEEERRRIWCDRHGCEVSCSDFDLELSQRSACVEKGCGGRLRKVRTVSSLMEAVATTTVSSC